MTVTNIRGDIGRILEYLQRKYEQGEIRYIAVSVLNHDDTFETGWSKGASYIERIGVAEHMKREIEEETR